MLHSNHLFTFEVKNNPIRRNWEQEILSIHYIKVEMCLLVTVTWPHAGSSGECHTTVTTTTSHISCILESTPCGELCTVTAPCSCPVFTCDYLFCFWMCLIEVFVLFMSIIPSKLLSYLLPTLTINTLSIVQSAAKSEHNAAWEVLAAVLQCCRVLSGQVEVVEWKQVSAVSIFPISPPV